MSWVYLNLFLSLFLSLSRTIEIPEEAQSSNGNITVFIDNNRYEFVTYIASFFVVGKCKSSADDVAY